MQITLYPFLAKMTLRFNPLRRVLVMCKGYSEDCVNFTELVWRDDKDLDFYDLETYPAFQLWVLRKTQKRKTIGHEPKSYSR